MRKRRKYLLYALYRLPFHSEVTAQPNHLQWCCETGRPWTRRCGSGGWLRPGSCSRPPSWSSGTAASAPHVGRYSSPPPVNKVVHRIIVTGNYRHTGTNRYCAVMTILISINVYLNICLTRLQTLYRRLLVHPCMQNVLNSFRFVDFPLQFRPQILQTVLYFFNNFGVHLTVCLAHYLLLCLNLLAEATRFLF